MTTAIHGIYVINLATRQDRWQIFLNGISSWQSAFGKTPERLPAIKGVDLPGYDMGPWFTPRISEQRKKSWGGKAGAVLSHRKAIQLAADQKLTSVLIVEDDAFISEEMVKTWNAGLINQLKNIPDDWAAINLCTTIPVSPCRVAGQYQDINLVEASGAFGAVAYLLNGNIFSKILNELPLESSIWSWVARHKTIDRWFSQNLMRFGKVYLFAPSVIGHNTGTSDISMSAENDWLLDFNLNDISYTTEKTIFDRQIRIRRINNALCRFFSFFRQGFKRIRGL